MTLTLSSTPPKQFPVVLQEDATGGYVASCPLFEGCMSQGETVEEALANITEAVQLCLEDAIERNEFPTAHIPRVGLHFVTIP